MFSELAIFSPMREIGEEFTLTLTLSLVREGEGIGIVSQAVRKSSGKMEGEKKMKRHWALALGMLLALAVTASACAPAAPAPTATPAPAKKEAAPPAATTAAQPTKPPAAAAQPWEKELKVATPYGTTGPVASWNVSTGNGIKMAREEINKAGGVAGRTLVFEHLDPGSDPTQAANLARQASDWTLVIISAGTTIENRGGVPVANAAGVPMLAVSSVPDLIKQNRPWSFGLLSDPGEFARKGIKAWVTREPTVKKVVLITDYEEPAAAAQAKGLEAGISEAKLELLDKVTFKTGDVDFTAQVTKAKSLKPDGVAISALPAELGALIREVRRQGITVPIFSTQTGWNPSVISKTAGEALEGVYAAIEWCSCDPRAQKFVPAYEAKFSEKVSQGAILLYDVVYRVKAAFEEAKLTGDPSKLKDERVKLRDTLADPKGWDGGVYGKWLWNKDGLPVKPGVLLQVQKAKEVQLVELTE